VEAVIAAVASAVLAGASTGVILAAASRGDGVRARRSLRDHPRLARRGGGCVAVFASVLAFAGVTAARHQQAGLALTCIAAASLIALASWLLLVEADDDDPGETSDEPEWWPSFERDLDEWVLRTRAPAGRS
jgi:hypothetical protein